MGFLIFWFGSGLVGLGFLRIFESYLNKGNEDPVTVEDISAAIALGPILPVFALVVIVITVIVFIGKTSYDDQQERTVEHE